MVGTCDVLESREGSSGPVVCDCHWRPSTVDSTALTHVSPNSRESTVEEQ